MTVIDDIRPDAEIIPFTPETLEPIRILAGLGTLSATGMQLSEELTYEHYEYLGTCLGAFERACRWWVGDWLVYGEDLYVDRYAQAARHTGLSEQTLINRTHIAKSIPPSRRRAKLSLSVHAVVASMKPREQKHWLDYAERNDCTVAQLRAAIKEAGREAPDPEPSTPSNDLDRDRIIAAVRRLVANAQEAGENVICRREDFVLLRVALGEEE